MKRFYQTACQKFRCLLLLFRFSFRLMYIRHTHTLAHIASSDLKYTFVFMSPATPWGIVFREQHFGIFLYFSIFLLFVFNSCYFIIIWNQHFWGPTRVRDRCDCGLQCVWSTWATAVRLKHVRLKHENLLLIKSRSIYFNNFVHVFFFIWSGIFTFSLWFRRLL